MGLSGALFFWLIGWKKGKKNRLGIAIALVL
jgi:hypothetical protein